MLEPLRHFTLVATHGTFTSAARHAFITQSADTSSRLTTVSTAVPDNSSQFDALLQNSTSMSTGAERVFTGVNKLLSGGNAGLTENEAYYANFATVLANTRTPGVDTGSIYSFFSAPIDAKDVTPERASVASVDMAPPF